MATPDLKKVREVFDAAAELAPAERAALLDRACGEDAGLRAEVERLLRAYDKADEFIEQPALAMFDSSATDHPTKEIFVEMTGQRIGQYRVVRELGRGGMGVVFLAERTDGEFHKLVAIKLLPPDAEESAVQRFRRERQILADLEHPNIARLMDGGTLDGQPYVVMEYVEGQSLRKILTAQGALPLKKVRVIAQQLCAGLEAAHQRGIVHRDIKPENLIISERDGEPRAKILDFGVAKLQQASSPNSPGAAMKTHTGLIIGTVSYMSPEQAAGASSEQIDSRSDIYSLGVMLYEMLTKQPVFTGDSALSILYKHQHMPPVPPHRLPTGVGISLAVSRVVLKALAKAPNARQQSAKQLAEELDAAFAHNTSPVYSPIRLLHRRLVYGLLIMSLIAGFLTWATIRWRSGVSIPLPKQTAQTAFVASATPIQLQYRIIKKDRDGRQAPLLADDVVLPKEEIQFEITLPFSGHCYLFYEKRGGSLIWANVGANHLPQRAESGRMLRVPEGEWIPFGEEHPRKQSFLAVYVPDDVLWSLEESVPAEDWKEILDHGPIRAQYAARMLSFFETNARQLTFNRPTTAGIYLAPWTETKPRQIIFHRIILWHAK